ncbi:cytochrome c biogenesis protein [Phosphitispora fastidiosa]|uniref:cytochrome c biogenesis protein n=1 Tax=Phosphitispora fastidiosa TaxID=2837202 RepID=UPI001E2F204B|nr:cytochrome c biogenesis protein CcsA [Phosphitispora fastidiosa]MBU7008036.1 cytochrome c-type biogenesis protein CcsB [Phosphitispora fastidiosa]
MSQPEMYFFWITVSCYVAASFSYLYRFLSGSAKADKVGTWLAATGAAVNFLALTARTVATGHLPVRTLYELNIVVAFLAVVVFLLARRYFPWVSLLGIISVSFAFLVMGWGYADSTEALPLTPAYKSRWLAVHVLFALTSTGCYVLGAAAGIFYLLKGRFVPGAEPERYHMLPDKETLEESGVKFILLGFIAGTIMIISGSIWAKLLWGKYWGWDPVETWSLVSWLIYGIFLHLRFTRGWKGSKLVWLGLGCLVTNIISFWAVGLVTPDTYHTLDQITRPIE